MGDPHERGDRDEALEDRPTLLLVDSDNSNRRFLEIILERGKRYEFESVQDAASAIEILSTTPVDLVISETKLVDMSGFHFLRRLHRENRLKNLPVMFLSQDSRVSSKIMAFELGAYDYLTKPFAMPELVARIDALVKRRTNIRLASQQSSYNLAGDFTGMSFTDLVNQLSMGQRTGRLNVVTRGGSGYVVFVRGKILHAVFGNLEGPEAFFQFMWQDQGRFEFCPSDTVAANTPNTIALAPTPLMMEGARRRDHFTRERDGDGDGVVHHLQHDAIPDVDCPLPAPGADDKLVRALIEVLEDDFRLAEMEIVPRSGLEKWTTPTLVEQRAMVLLVTDVTSGVSATSAIAAPLTDTQIQAALSTEPKALVLRFMTGENQSLEVMIIDQDAPAEFLPEIRTKAIAMILAPRDGDWLTLSVQATIELESAATWLEPVVITGIGNGSIREGLTSLADCLRPGGAMDTIPSRIDDPSFDLREVLVKVIRMWGAASPMVEAQTPVHQEPA